MGTATYFSPEQAEGMGVDARSDIYSLGVVLYEMVTGRPPFLGDTPVAVASKHVREHAPAPREINPGVPPDLEAIILKCLAKSADNRYATGDDLRIDLLRFREGRAVAAVTNPIPQPPTGQTQAVAAVRDGTQALPMFGTDEHEDDYERSHTGFYAALLAVLLAALAVVVILLGNSLGWWHLGGPPASFALPDVSSQSVTQAEATLHRDGLKTKVRSDPSATTVPNTQVLRTDPTKGSAVHKGQTVTVVTGGQGPPVKVANVEGFSISAAKSQLESQGLQVVQQTSTNCTTQNIVCNQSPKRGRVAAPGQDRDDLHRRDHHADTRRAQPRPGHGVQPPRSSGLPVRHHQPAAFEFGQQERRHQRVAGAGVSPATQHDREPGGVDRAVSGHGAGRGGGNRSASRLHHQRPRPDTRHQLRADAEPGPGRDRAVTEPGPADTSQSACDRHPDGDELPHVLGDEHHHQHDILSRSARVRRSSANGRAGCRGRPGSVLTVSAGRLRACAGSWRAGRAPRG